MANCQPKTPAIFRRTFENFRCVSKSVRIYATIARGTLNDVLQNSGWETLRHTDFHTLTKHWMQPIGHCSRRGTD
jgi:hypothetical protein